jgi:hypothetical protein
MGRGGNWKRNSGMEWVLKKRVGVEVGGLQVK